jgi:hypothetical protein
LPLAFTMPPSTRCVRLDRAASFTDGSGSEHKNDAAAAAAATAAQLGWAQDLSVRHHSINATQSAGAPTPPSGWQVVMPLPCTGASLPSEPKHNVARESPPTVLTDNLAVHSRVSTKAWLIYLLTPCTPQRYVTQRTKQSAHCALHAFLVPVLCSGRSS